MTQFVPGGRGVWATLGSTFLRVEMWNEPNSCPVVVSLYFSRFPGFQSNFQIFVFLSACVSVRVCDDDDQ